MFREKDYKLSKHSREKAKEHKKWDKAEPIAQGYNTHCKWFEMTGGEINCRIKTELCFCGVNCAFASTNPDATPAYKAKTVVYRRRG